MNKMCLNTTEHKHIIDTQLCTHAWPSGTHYIKTSAACTQGAENECRFQSLCNVNGTHTAVLLARHIHMHQTLASASHSCHLEVPQGVGLLRTPVA